MGLLLNRCQMKVRDHYLLNSKKGFLPASSLSCLKEKHLPKAIVYRLHTAQEGYIPPNCSSAWYLREASKPSLYTQFVFPLVKTETYFMKANARALPSQGKKVVLIVAFNEERKQPNYMISPSTRRSSLHGCLCFILPEGLVRAQLVTRPSQIQSGFQPF